MMLQDKRKILNMLLKIASGSKIFRKIECNINDALILDLFIEERIYKRNTYFG